MKEAEDQFTDILAVYGFASDQSPRLFAQQYWADFMGINVPVYDGAETLSRKFDMNVIFLKTRKVKRGYYEATFELMTRHLGMNFAQPSPPGLAWKGPGEFLEYIGGKAVKHGRLTQRQYEQFLED